MMAARLLVSMMVQCISSGLKPRVLYH